MSATDDEMRLVTEGSDREWSEATGSCGGCGDRGCHEGRPCNLTNPGWWDPICDACPCRHAQGMHEHLDRLNGCHCPKANP